MHSFIFRRLAMTVPKQSLVMRGKRFLLLASGPGAGVGSGAGPAHNLLTGAGLSTAPGGVPR
jgi:hypothetical protein